ncbi:flagellar basal body P-ring formation chaperone FlgA [Caballeronia sp. LP006]|uniref:flagellar basal body P-ring formation chaperone FlgA n=1 Tax=Caballeronia sp. LP006 TaxID=3038552 RepID=UPI002856214B|nr:flagellar basal body P-ring formation chaperone FlgA [Caballeronia sp. LP006]MDR5829769.1 flagellar basal body P-ring formation chaperone FlgA [Caballeronia sp. LP006]
MSRSASHSSKALARVAAMERRVQKASSLARRSAAGVALLFVGAAGFGFTANAYAQQDDGPIVIPGNAETNPAAAAEMAKGLKTAKAAPATAPAPVAAVSPAAISSAMMSRPSGYGDASKAADAAMRHAALALEARAEAADDAMDDASGMIVIPGPGEAKAQTGVGTARAAAPANQNAVSGAMSAPVSKVADALGAAQTAAQSVTAANANLRRVASVTPSRDVIPVVVTRDDAIPARNGAVRPIAAGTTAPVSSAASPMKRVSFNPSAAAGAAAAPAATTLPQANATGATVQDGESIRAAAVAFLQQQTAGLPGKVEITVTPAFPRGLAPCSSIDPFMPTGARLWGRMTVGVRCVGERPWTLYLQARVAINATYYTAARAIAPGEMLGQGDVVAHEGDITAMPQATVTDPAQAVGAIALSRVPAGLPLRTDMLRAASSVAVGQTVHVVTDGSGFSISAEGSVMNNAAPGQQVRVKTANGQIITGIVKDSQTVEIRM